MCDLRWTQFGGTLKGQIKPKADWRAADSPKNELTGFFGEYTGRKSAFGFI